MRKILESAPQFDRPFVLFSEERHLQESEREESGVTVLTNCIESSTCSASWTRFIAPYFAAFASSTIHSFV